MSWITAIVLGSLWYGVFFREIWMAATGVTQSDMGNPVTSMVVMAVCYFILALGLGLAFAAMVVKSAGRGQGGGWR